MTTYANRLAKVLAASAAAAIVATALTAAVVASASPTACKVTNVDKGIGRDSLQRAVWAADAGDTLLVQGTCVGTTVISKPLTIGWARISATDRLGGGTVSDSGPPMLRSGSWRPTLIIDHAVDDLRILRGGAIKQGFVIGDAQDWRVRSKAAAPAYWTRWGRARPVLSGYQRWTLDTCALWNPWQKRMRSSLAAAVDAAAPGARLVLAGRCKGPTTLAERVYVHGSRVPGNHGCHEDPGSDAIVCIDYIDHGPPKITGLLDIAAGVDQLAFKRLTLKGGIRIH